MSGIATIIGRGTFAARPAAGTAGSVYFDTTNGKQWRDNGTTWDDVTPTVAALADATTTTTGGVLVDHAPSGSHPVALTTDGTSLPTGMLGTSGTTAAAGNDSRLSNSRTPTGSAGGDLTGTYPNPTLDLTLAHTFSNILGATAASISGLTGSTAGMRLVGATASGAPTTGAHLVGDVSLSLADGLWYTCTVAGTPGTWVTPSGGSSVTVQEAVLSADSNTTSTGFRTELSLSLTAGSYVIDGKIQFVSITACDALASLFNGATELDRGRVTLASGAYGEAIASCYLVLGSSATINLKSLVTASPQTVDASYTRLRAVKVA